MTQKNSIRLLFLGVIILTLAAAIYDFPSHYNKLSDQVREKTKIALPKFPEKPFLLGLDLQGGTHLVYSADVTKVPISERAAAIEGVKDVLDRRVNAFGVSEPNIQTSHSGDNWNVIVELAGVRDVNQAIKMIGETPALDFRVQSTSTVTVLTDAEKKQLNDYNSAAKKKADDALKQAQAKNADFDALAAKISEEPGAADTKGKLPSTKRGALVQEFEKACFDNLKVGETSKTLTQTAFGYHIIKKLAEQGTGDTYEATCQHILIRTKTENDIHPVEQWVLTSLSGEFLTTSRVVFDPNTNQPQVMLNFNDQGKELFKNITTQNVGNVIGIFLDGEVISAPRVNEPILTGDAVISGSFGLAEARLLAQRLNAGALRVPITLVSQQTVGPTLGQLSINQSFKAGMIGLALVIIFMLLIYRLPGLLANIALICYGVLLLAVFKFIPVTLSLAGIFGFILSIGMAVDANILIFERMKEELRRGKTLQTAVEEGFKRAWPSIRDGNFSTIITSLVLVWFSTSVVKGFAITLILGILVSIFASMVITRIFLTLLAKVTPEKLLWFYGVKRKKV